MICTYLNDRMWFQRCNGHTALSTQWGNNPVETYIPMLSIVSHFSWFFKLNCCDKTTIVDLLQQFGYSSNVPLSLAL